MPENHALLSASSAHRWMNCTPCARLEEQFPDTTSDFAREGTLAHSIAELKLRKKFTEPMSQKTFTSRMNKLKKQELYQEEMQGHTDAYIDYITECAMRYEHMPTVAAEVRLDFSAWVPEGFGTGDCVMIGGDTLHIIDFKYGKGVSVSAQDNPQMRLYALGALQAFGMIYPVKQVCMAIVQPRIDNLSEDTISVEELMTWAENTVKPAAALAFAGAGKYKAGEWCRFCRARIQCRERANHNTQLIEDFGAPPEKEKPCSTDLLTNAEIADALVRIKPFLAWAKDLEEYALQAVLNGEGIPGWKAVEGRSTRSFSDMDSAFAELVRNGVDESLLYERKPLTLAQVEKVVGKANLQTFAGHYIVKPQGKPTLAPVSDKRPVYSTAAADFANLDSNTKE